MLVEVNRESLLQRGPQDEDVRVRLQIAGVELLGTTWHHPVWFNDNPVDFAQWGLAAVRGALWRGHDEYVFIESPYTISFLHAPSNGTIAVYSDLSERCVAVASAKLLAEWASLDVWLRATISARFPAFPEYGSEETRRERREWLNQTSLEQARDHCSDRELSPEVRYILEHPEKLEA